MNIQRLRSMALGEIVGRGRQEAAKWLDRAGASLTDPRARRPVASAGYSWRIDWHRFFAGAGSSVVPDLIVQQQARGGIHDVVSAADNACRGHFDLLGYRALSFGDPIDWHFDPVSGTRAPRVHWSRLDPLDRQTVGDSKVIWELNRHQWFVQLAQAYRLTGDERYAEAFALHIREWMQANPRGMGLNWASSLEVAFRLIAWSWSLHLFRGFRALPRDVRDAMFEGIHVHAAHIERYLSHYFSPNTHLTGEALGLFYAAVMVRPLPQSERWRRVGTRILIEQCERQIAEDGVYFEQAIGYQRYTLEIYLHLLILAERNDWPLPPIVGKRVHAMLDFLLAIRRPDGSMPMIGDADSGSLLPLVPRAQSDFDGVFAVAAAALGRADCAWAAGGAAPEVFWLLGPAGLDAFDALVPEPPATSSRVFRDGGYAIMQNGWERHRHQLTFDVGPLGCPVSGGHGHADLLSVQCAAFGEPYLVDAGTYVYTGDATSRAFFRGTAAHSTVMVDGKPQAAPTGPFKWTERPRASLRAWQSTEVLDVADASHSACGPDIAHRRRVVFVKPRYWVIVDDVYGSGEHEICVRFQFAPMDVSLGDDGWARARGHAGHALLVRAFAASPLQARLVAGAVSPMEGWVSDEYGRRQAAPCLSYTTLTTLPFRVTTVLFPLADPEAAAPRVTQIDAGLSVDGSEEVCISDTGVRLTRWVFSPAAPTGFSGMPDRDLPIVPPKAHP